MRQLANLSAQTAIDASHHSRLVTIALGKALMAVISFVAAAIMFYFTTKWLSISFIGVLIAVTGGLYWTAYSFRMGRTARGLRKQLHQRTALVAGSGKSA